LLKDLGYDIPTEPEIDKNNYVLLVGFKRHWEFLLELGINKWIELVISNHSLIEQNGWLFNTFQPKSKTYIDFNSYRSNNEGEFDQFAQAVMEFDGLGLKMLRWIWMDIIRHYLFDDRFDIWDQELLKESIKSSIVYFYLQVVEHFNGDYSEKILYTDKMEEFDIQLAFKAFHIYFRFFQEGKTEKQTNLLQENNSDNILFPSYIMLLRSLLNAITSRGDQKQSYFLTEEGLKERLRDDETAQKALTYMDRHSSHIQILSHPKRLNGKQEKETIMFMIPPVFKYLTQEKKDQLWLSFDKENAESLWMSVWKNWHEICREFYAREQVNQMTLFGFFSENETKICRLIEHLILATNLLVLITQGYKDDHPQLGPIPYLPTLLILFFFGTCMLSMSWMAWLTSLIISLKSRKRDKPKEDSQSGKCIKCYKLAHIMREFGKAIYKELALFVCIIFAVLAYVDTTLYWGWLVFVVVRQKSMMNVIKAVWMAKYLLTATIALILIAIYFFAVFSVLVLKSDYDKTLSGSWENAWFCSVTIFDSWYKADGTIGGWLDEEAPSLSSGDEYNTDGVRIISDFIFNFIIGILLLEIFSGILTDTFAKIRSEQEELNSIQESRCFVCNKENKEFADFKHHTQYDHNLWDYIIYLFTLIHSKDNKYQELIEKKGKGNYLEEKKEGDEREGYTKCKSNVLVRGIEYLEAIIDKKLLLDNSDDYVRACLAHYELAKDEKIKSFEMRRYLSWLPNNIGSKEDTRIERKIKITLEENAKFITDEFEKKVEEIVKKEVKVIVKKEVKGIVKKEVNYLEERIDKKMFLILEMMSMVLHESKARRRNSLY
jgi:hypothetical protein